VLRYADVLLMRAEALIELNQLTPEVYTLINRVRQRVNMRTIEAAEGTNLSQDALRQILRHERRVEFAMEGLRFYDLKRWGLVEDAFKRAIADNIPGYVPVFQGLKSEIFPVPQTEIDVNNKMVQHPAWR
jgi:starch-binding outer membrane protein, SusD/RagB family